MSAPAPSNQNPARPAFCFKGMCPDGKTTVYVNVVGDPDPSLIPVTRGGNVPLGSKGGSSANSGEAPPPSLSYLDTHGLGNLMVPIAVGESRKLANPDKPRNPLGGEQPTTKNDDIELPNGLGSLKGSSSNKTNSASPLVQEIQETTTTNNSSATMAENKKKPKKKISSKMAIDYENSVVVDVVVYSGVTHRVHPLHPLFESYLTHLIPLTLQWVQQEQGLVILPNTVAMLTVLDPSIRASEETARRVGEKILSGAEGEGLRGTKYIVGERKNMIFPPGTKLSDDPFQAAAIKVQEEETAFWSKINDAADVMSSDFKKMEGEAKKKFEAEQAEQEGGGGASSIPKDFMVGGAGGKGSSLSGVKKSPLIEEIFGDDNKKADEETATASDSTKKEGSFVKRGFLNQKNNNGEAARLYPEGGSTEGQESAKAAAVAYREAQLANIPASLRGKCQIVDMTGIDDKKKATPVPAVLPAPALANTYQQLLSSSKSSTAAASQPATSTSTTKDIIIEDEADTADWTHTIAWNGSNATITVEIRRAEGGSGGGGPPGDVEIEASYIDIEEGSYIIPLVAQQSKSTPMYQLTVDHDNASAAYSKKRGVLTIKAAVLSAKKAQ